ncbi:hypothetical protein FKP32DRAFT_1600312, partial [Trametes sanguinea]
MSTPANDIIPWTAPPENSTIAPSPDRWNRPALDPRISSGTIDDTDLEGFGHGTGVISMTEKQVMKYIIHAERRIKVILGVQIGTDLLGGVGLSRSALIASYMYTIQGKVISMHSETAVGMSALQLLALSGSGSLSTITTLCSLPIKTVLGYGGACFRDFGRAQILKSSYWRKSNPLGTKIANRLETSKPLILSNAFAASESYKPAGNTTSPKRSMSSYTFSASAPVQRTGVTILPFSTPWLPSQAGLDAEPTLLRQFQYPVKSEAGAEESDHDYVPVVGRRPPLRPSLTPRRSLSSGPRFASRPLTPARTLSSSPELIVSALPLSPRRGSVYVETPGPQRNVPFLDLQFARNSPSQRHGPNVITRSRERSLILPIHIIRHDCERYAIYRVGNELIAAAYQSDADVDEDVRTLIRNSRKCPPSEPEKRRVPRVQYYTYWYESNGMNALSSPPTGMATRRDLQLGDLFCFHVPHLDDPQIWQWCEIDNHRRMWRSIEEGCIREDDGRRLLITASKNPSWVGDAWYKKKIKARDAQKTAESKGKGRARQVQTSTTSVFPALEEGKREHWELVGAPGGRQRQMRAAEGDRT